MSLKKIDLIESVYSNLGIPKKDSISIVESLFEIMRADLAEGNNIKISGFGKWSSDAGSLPILPVLNTYGIPVLGRHPDIFNSNIQAQLRSVLAAQIVPRLQDPLIVGWSLHNEDRVRHAREVDRVDRDARPPGR